MKKLLALVPILLLLLVGRSEAAITATGQQCNAVGTGASVSCTVSVTSGNTVIFMGIYNQSGRGGGFNTTGCGDNKSNVYHLVQTIDNNGGIKMCYAPVTTTASTTFTWTNSVGNDDCGIVVIEFSGVITTSPPLDQTKVSTTNATSATTYATTTADQVVVTGYRIQASGTLTCGAGYTQIAEDESWFRVSYSTCYKIISATGTQQMNWTSPAGTSSNIIATFSQNKNGLTGAGTFFTGHQCDVPLGGSRTTSVTCVLPLNPMNAIILVGAVQEARIGTTDNAGCSDSNSNTYTYIIVSAPANGQGVKICAAYSGSADSIAVTWTSQGGTGFNNMSVFEVAGLDTTTDQTATNSGSGANATTGTTSATTHPDDLIIAALNPNTGGTLTCGAGYTQISKQDGNGGYSVCYKVVSVTGTQSMTWTSSAGNWASAIAALGGASANSTGLLPWLR